MNFEEMWILWIVIGIICIVILVKIIEFFIGFRKDIKYMKKERNRSYSEREYAYWTKQIRKYYLGMIPFLFRKLMGLDKSS